MGSPVGLSELASPSLDVLSGIQQKILWLSAYMIHHANRIRANADSIKVGGHQASCASSVRILTAYYFGASQPDVLISIKPHAAPVYHAIQYLLGNLPRSRTVGTLGRLFPSVPRARIRILLSE